MTPQVDDKQKRHITQVVKFVNDILEAQSVILQRIETSYQENLQTFNEFLNRVNLLDKKVEGGFSVLETNRLTSLDKKVSDKLRNLEYNYLIELKQKLDAVHTKLFQQIQARMFQLLVKKSLKAPRMSFSKAAPSEKTAKAAPFRGPYAQRAHAATASTPQPVQLAETPTGDWSESELEGAEIYDAIITTWKRRDWEKVQGTKEIFMRGWKKLSKTDKQKIKNGAWSKQIMNKIKLLGRPS
ncbi:MAG: hypothetical protein ACFFD2_11185 [Promethearchaeota archaeon]